MHKTPKTFSKRFSWSIRGRFARGNLNGAASDISQKISGYPLFISWA
jgi:hypothetical protein